MKRCMYILHAQAEALNKFTLTFCLFFFVRLLPTIQYPIFSFFSIAHKKGEGGGASSHMYSTSSYTIHIKPIGFSQDVTRLLTAMMNLTKTTANYSSWRWVAKFPVIVYIFPNRTITTRKLHHSALTKWTVSTSLSTSTSPCLSLTLSRLKRWTTSTSWSFA